MTEDRLNNVILLHVHKEETDHLDLQQIASYLQMIEDTHSLVVLHNVYCTTRPVYVFDTYRL